MKRLALIRHAKSDLGSSDLSDRERPLNARGQRDAPSMGERLRESGFHPDRIVSSPALRAQTTAELIAAELGFEPISLDESIYEGGRESLLNLVASQAPDVETLVLVGHNPGFSELCRLLAGEATPVLPPCAVAQLELDITSWQEVSTGCGRLIDFDHPKR